MCDLWILMIILNDIEIKWVFKGEISCCGTGYTGSRANILELYENFSVYC